MNQQMDFYNGYTAAMEEVHELLTTGGGRIESHEQTLAFVQDALGKQ